MASTTPNRDNGSVTHARRRSKDSSTPDRCPICLTEPDNKAVTDQCFHAFCFDCLKEWSKVKPECPLCKTVFRSILYNIRGNDDYDQFFVTQPVLPRFPSEDVYAVHRRLADTFAHFMSAQVHEWRSPIRLQQENVNAALIASTNIEIIRRRRLYYRHNHRVTHVNNKNKVRDISPTFFRNNPAQIHRLAPWIRRELIILFGANNMLLVRRVRDLILSAIGSIGITSKEFYDALHPYLRDKTGHFIAEFIAFARSPHDISTYDRNTTYSMPESSHDSDFQDTVDGFWEVLDKKHTVNQLFVAAGGRDTLSSLHNYYSYDSYGQRSMAVEAPLSQASARDAFTSSWSRRLRHGLMRRRRLLGDPRLPPPPPIPPTNVVDEVIEITSSPEPERQEEETPGTSQDRESDVNVDGDADDEDDDNAVTFVSYTKPLDKRTPEAFIDLTSDDEEGNEEVPGPSGISTRPAKWSSSSGGSSSTSSLSSEEGTGPYAVIKSVVVPVVSASESQASGVTKLKLKGRKRSSLNLLSKKFVDRRRTIEDSDSDSDVGRHHKKKRKMLRRL